jgi:hypothetical protein
MPRCSLRTLPRAEAGVEFVIARRNSPASLPVPSSIRRPGGSRCLGKVWMSFLLECRALLRLAVRPAAFLNITPAFASESLNSKGRTGRVVLPDGTNLMGVARHTPCHGFLPGLTRARLFLRLRARRDMAKDLSPPKAPLPSAAIGRPLSRMPVYTRSP